MDTPYAYLLLERTSSTQDDARRLLFDHPRVVVAARHQTAGRGRRGRTWQNATRVLATSVGFRPGWPADTWPRLTLVAGLAARDALGPGVALKWPNDLVADGAKVGGLLSEADEDRLIIGLGVNLFWVDPPPGMGGLYRDDPGPDAIGPLSRAFADALFHRLEPGPEDWGREEYRAASATLGRTIRWDPGGVGVAVDVAADGSLVVDAGGRHSVITSGEVWHVRDAERPDPA